jgi:uncharacterized membrane protein
VSDLSARQRLDTPRTSRRRFTSRVDIEAVGRFSESIARFLGTGRYLAMQTVLVIVWIALNLFAVGLQWDPYPFILLNLAFSTQAAYAEQTKADTEYLARELAAVRLAVGEVATRDYLRRELEEVIDLLNDLRSKQGDVTS